MLKKLSLITTICLSVGTVTAVASAEKQAFTESEEYGLICAISASERYMPYSEENVNRSEFVAAFVSALGLENVSGAELNFNDVSRGSEIYGLLSSAVGMSFISNSQNFRPDDSISLNEALKICVTACGYGVEAEYAGGYPNGYLAIAGRLGITKGISSGSVLSSEDAYRLIYNTFEADYLVRNNDGYEKGSSNVLAVYRDIELVKGIVTSNELTKTGGYEEAEIKPYQLKGTIGIDYESYKVTDDYNKYLGYSVRAYVTENEYDEKTVVYVHTGKNNTEVEFISSDLCYEDGYIYRENEHRKHYDINKSAEIIYNGRVRYDYNLTELNNICGSVKIVDNNNDGKYDYVIVDDYYYMQIDSFDIDDMVIRDRYDVKKAFSVDEDTLYSIYDSEGQIADLSAVEPGLTLAVKKSADGCIAEAVIISKTVSGQVESYSEKEICIDGQSYIPSDYFIENDFKGLRGGGAFDFYIGINNEMVAISYSENTMLYGYLVSSYLDENEEKLVVKIFTHKGKMERYTCEETIVCDGTKATSASVQSKIEGNRQLIRYSVNAEKKLKAIDLSETVNGYVDERSIEKKNDSLSRNAFAKSTYYYRSAMFYPYFNIQDTLIFRVPTFATADDDAYQIGYTFTDGDIADGLVEVYDTGFDGTATAMVVYADNDDTTINQVSPKIVLVEKVYKEVNKDNEAMVTIIGWESGKFTKHYVKDGISILKNREEAQIETGDVLRYTENSDGVITAAVVEFIGKSRTPNVGDNLGMFNFRSMPCHYQIGSVYSVENSWALISNIPDSDGYSYSGEMINVKIPDVIAIYNETTKKIRTGTKSDIKTYLNSENEASYILVKQYYGTSNFCIVFER